MGSSAAFIAALTVVSGGRVRQTESLHGAAVEMRELLRDGSEEARQRLLASALRVWSLWWSIATRQIVSVVRQLRRAIRAKPLCDAETTGWIPIATSTCRPPAVAILASPFPGAARLSVGALARYYVGGEADAEAGRWQARRRR